MDPLSSVNASGFDLADIGLHRPGPNISARDVQSARRAAAEFETFFLTQFLETIQSDISTEAPFGGGPGERAFRSFLTEEHARAIVDSGGIGIADRLYRDILALQTEEPR